MAKALCGLACILVVAYAAPLEEKFLPHFLESETVTVPTAVVNASPIVVSQGSPGKKVQITITKEVTTKADHASHAAVAANSHAHAQSAPHVHQHDPHEHEHHEHSAALEAAPAHLRLDNSPIVLDNETMAGVLQNLLAGNIENVQAHGQPLVVPPGGKPVAVIFSSAMHVVDLGDLLPPKAPAHHHHSHNHTEHPPINHTSLLQSLMSPLISLAHIGEQHPVAAPAAQVAASFGQPMQMQPIVVMMPLPQHLQSIAAPAAMQVDASAQLGGLLQGILNAKQQILDAAAASHAAHSAHDASAQVPAAVDATISADIGAGTPAVVAEVAAGLPVVAGVRVPAVAAASGAQKPVVAATNVQVPAVSAADAELPVFAITGTGVNAEVPVVAAGVPVVAVPQRSKKVDISITKTKIV